MLGKGQWQKCPFALNHIKSIQMKTINPNSDRDNLRNIDLNDKKYFPLFVKEIRIQKFRSINNLNLNFRHPISVISGTNRCGKTSVLIAIACSHYEFKKRNPSNGKFERHTWNSMIRFTKHDRQADDWIYHIVHKAGKEEPPKRGIRKNKTGKWSGVAKKEGQIKKRSVVFIDIDRALPVRDVTSNLYRKAEKGKSLNDSPYKEIVDNYISYIFEEEYQIANIASHLNVDAYSFKNKNSYSSFNSASGEDAVTNIVTQIVEAPKNSLILIEELEVGLHPRIQRKLIDIIHNISRNDHKQFIITTHSPTVLSCVEPKSRLFIEVNYEDKYKAISEISINAALSKMDSISYPLIDLYCEDATSHKIIDRLISDVQKEMHLYKLSELINVIESGSAPETYQNFKVHQRTYDKKKIKVGSACILDGDMQDSRNGKNEYLYPKEDLLFFLCDKSSPERFLVSLFNGKQKNSALKYHINLSPSHCLFEKMTSLGICNNKDNAFQICWDFFKKTQQYKTYKNEFNKFIIKACKGFSPDL